MDMALRILQAFVGSVIFLAAAASPYWATDERVVTVSNWLLWFPAVMMVVGGFALLASDSIQKEFGKKGRMPWLARRLDLVADVTIACLCISNEWWVLGTTYMIGVILSYSAMSSAARKVAEAQP